MLAMDSRDAQRQALIEQARHSSQAVPELLQLYVNYLKLLARGWLDTQLRVKVDASDVVQETMIKAHQHFEQFRGSTEAELAAWLRQIMSRNLVDLARRYKQAQVRDVGRERPLEAQLGETSQVLGALLQAPGESPSAGARGRELAVILADALAELDEDQCEIVILRGLFQLSWEEVAQRMDRTPGAVRMVWTRSLARLKPLVQARL